MAMWRLLKRLFYRPASSSVEPDSEVIHFDERGFSRSSHLTRTMNWRQSWRWDEITAFGFDFSPSMFPDPWFGDVMEGRWFFAVTSESGPEHIYFDQTWLDIDHLPPVLVQNLPGLDLDEVRQGLIVAAGGFHNYAGEGRWIGWQRTKPPKRARRSNSAKPVKRKNPAK
ncbi:hypothetical protein J2X72_000081 [Phyllobacterium sp. 1468]|nr:hypothetical protein [Phyllobacterium sp. 1468]